MSPLPFLSSATGDPTRSQRRITGQPTLGVEPGADASWRDVCQNGGPIRIAIGSVDRLAIGKSGTLSGKKSINQFSWALGDVNPADYGLLWCMANLFGFYANSDQTTYRRWTFGRSQATAADPYIGILNDTDVVPRTVIYDGSVIGMTLAAEPNGNFTAVADIISGSHHFLGDPTQGVGSGSTKPIMGGMLLDSSAENQSWAETPEDYGLKVISNTSGVLVLEGLIGAGSFTGTNTFTYTIGDPPAICLDENGDRVGKLSDPLTVYWPSGATVAANDEFTVPANRTRWTQSLGTDRAIAAINTGVYLDGSLIRIENGWSIRSEWEQTELKVNTSGAQGGTPIKAGKYNTTIEIDRELVNLDLQKAMYNADSLAFVFEGETDAQISGASRPYLFRGVAPACKPEGELFGVEEGAENTNEPVTLKANDPDSAYTWPVGSGLSYSDAINFIIENDVAAL